MHTWRRTIIHVDMDAFFAAIEQRDKPELRGQPVIVGGRPEGRGVVSTASYEARKYGVRSALPMAVALRMCPRAVLISPDHRRYVQVSKLVHEIFGRYSETVEPLSIDEAFLDVSGKDSIAIAVAIRRDISSELELTASVGLSYNKFLAKLASDMNKPDGLTILTPACVDRLLPTLSVRAIPGIGEKTSVALDRIGIRTVADLRRTSPQTLKRVFGSRAQTVLDLAYGIDDREVVTERLAKSFGEETTFAEDVSDARHIGAVLAAFSEDLMACLARDGSTAYTVTVKCKYPDFRTMTRSATRTRPVSSASDLHSVALELLARLPRGPIRLIGLQVSNLHRDDLFSQDRLF